MASHNLGFRFTLVSYNILSQTLLHNHSYLYRNCSPKDLEWPRRGHRIVSELIDNQADIICLQEVECEHLQTLYQPKLDRHGYDCLYKKKTGYKIDGCAIFYKRKAFHLLNYKGIEFNRTDLNNLLNRDNVGIIAVLKPKYRQQNNSASQKQLVIANTHLIFNPKRSDIKLAQLKLFLSELEEMSFKHYDSVKDTHHHHPTILCGDLNSIPDSDVNRFIMRKEPSFKVTNSNDVENNESEERQSTVNNDIMTNKESEESDEKKTDDDETGNIELNQLTSHKLKFKSVYPTKTRTGQPYVSTFSSCIVDYIFYTPESLRLESYIQLLTEEELEEIGPIPNSMFPSDHLTLEAKFALR